MQKSIVFAFGAAAGAIGGVVMTLALSGPGDAPSDGFEPGGHGSTDSLPAGTPVPLPAATSVPPSDDPSTPVVHEPGSEAATPPGHTPPPGPSGARAAEDEAAARAALEQAMAKAMAQRESKQPGRYEQWRHMGRELVDWNPNSAKDQELFRQALADLAGSDTRAASGAGYALGWAGMQGRFSDGQLEELYRTLRTLLDRGEANGTFTPHRYGRGLELDPPIDATDAPGWIAYICAAGWKTQPDKLRRLTAQIPADRHPTVHLGVLTAIGRHAADTTRAYLTRLTRGASDQRVLQRAWNRNTLGAVANRAWAGEFLSVLEGRLVRWDLTATLRARGWQAAIECGLQVPERGSAMLRTAAGQEPNAGNRAFATAAAQLLEGGLIDGAAVDALIQKHPPTGE